MAAWTAAPTAQFRNSMSDHRLYAAYHLIALRSLRRGEAAGLSWRDVDLDGKAAGHGLIRARRSAARGGAAAQAP